MKKLFLLFIWCTSLPLLAQTRPAPGLNSEEDAPIPDGPDLMRQVRLQLPPVALQLNGKVRTRYKREQQDRRLVTVLRFGDPVPRATYTLSDSFGDLITKVQVSWPEGQPEFEQWDAEGEKLEAPSPQDSVADTGLTWSDMALDFLWWPEAESLERDIVKTRSAILLKIPAPPERKDVAYIKLWVDERAKFIVRAELYDAKNELLKRIEVDSIKKIRDDFWMVKDLIIQDKTTGRRMGIRFEEVVEMDP